MEVLKIFDRHYRWFIGAIIAIIAIAIIITITIPIVRYNSRPTILEIGVAPTSAKVEINGETYRNGTYDFEPGDYTARISLDDFDSKEINFTVKKHEQTSVKTYLVHKKEGLEYYERSAADLAALRYSSDDEQVQKFLEKYDQKTKIKELFPINASYNLKDTNPNPRAANHMIFMYINDGSTHKDCHHAFCLLVTGDRKNPDRIREMVKNCGYNYDDYEVIYD